MHPTRSTFALLVAFLLATPAAFAKDRIQDQDQDRISQEEALQQAVRLRERLHQEDGIPMRQLKDSEQEMARYLRHGGEGEQLRATVRTGWQNGCGGACLQEMVRTQSWARSWGMSDAESSTLVCDALRTRLQERDRTGAGWSDEELGARVRTQAQQQLRAWETERDQRQLQERLQEQQRQHQREMDRMQQNQRQGGPGGRQG